MKYTKKEMINLKRVRFFPDNIEITVQGGSNLLEVAASAGLRISSNCGGQGVCGKCVLKVIKGKIASRPHARLNPEQIEEGFCISCVTKVDDDLIVEIPAVSRLSEGTRVAQRYTTQNLVEYWASSGKEVDLLLKKVDLELPHPTLDHALNDCDNMTSALAKAGLAGEIEIPLAIVRQLSGVLRKSDYRISAFILSHGGVDTVMKVTGESRSARRYGLAVDIGTTSIVVFLVDLSNGEICGSDSCYNSQVRHGDDVISRIVYTEQEGGLSDLQGLVVGDINRLMESACSKAAVAQESVETIVVSGNATMMHLFYGVDPLPIREEPYVPTCNHFLPVLSREVGLNLDALLVSLPGVASYVGGDITSGVMASGIYKDSQLNLFIDIGTNGEIVIGNSDWLMSAACSAGPCFEGSSILCGMRATEGAIEEVDIDPETFDVRLGVIGGYKPVGICGSGMIDALANMLITGVINQKGKFATEKTLDRIRDGDYGKEFVISWKEETGTGQNIVLTEVDIENIIRAKGAIYAGMSVLLSELGFSFADLNSIVVAGGFGKYIDVKKAKIIGLFPEVVDDEKFLFLGNTSVAGAYLALLSGEFRNTTVEIAHKMTNLELSVMSSFMDEYVSALFLPHTDIAAFPKIMKLFNGKNPGSKNRPARRGQ